MTKKSEPRGVRVIQDVHPCGVEQSCDSLLERALRHAGIILHDRAIT